MGLNLSNLELNLSPPFQKQFKQTFYNISSRSLIALGEIITTSSTNVATVVTNACPDEKVNSTFKLTSSSVLRNRCAAAH